MKPSISESEFEFLCKNNIPVSLTAEQKADLYRAYGHIEEMRRLVRKPRSHTDEPAHIFIVTDKGASHVE
ncbi:MAG TPA: hypothetical protein VG271_18375 [Beijerinckiaceae bacterium]|nr:hypothetical protein [Beijerinckiaceae bacterium]